MRHLRIPIIVSAVGLVLSLTSAVGHAQSRPSESASPTSPISFASPPRVWIGGDKQTLEDPQLRSVVDCVVRKAREFQMTLVDGQQPRQYTIEFSQQLGDDHRRGILDKLVSAADQAEEARLNRFLRCPAAAEGRRCLRATMLMDRSIFTRVAELIRQSGQMSLGHDVKDYNEGIDIFLPTQEAEEVCSYFVEQTLKPIRINSKLLAGAEEQVRTTRTGSPAMARQP